MKAARAQNYKRTSILLLLQMRLKELIMMVRRRIRKLVLEVRIMR